MGEIDKKMSQLETFSGKEDDDVDDPSSKFSGINSISELKGLLKNYDLLVEGQHTLLSQSLSKMAKIPPPADVANTFAKFNVLKDSELEEMRVFLKENK